MKKAGQFFSNTIKGFNLFTSPVNLRYQLQPDYNTFTGGCCSVLLILILLSLFSTAWISVFNKDSISQNTLTVRQSEPQQLILNSDDFMFAVGISSLNMSDSSEKYFDINVIQIITTNMTKQTRNKIKFSQCTEDHWSQLGSQFVSNYDRSQLSSHLCPDRNTTFKVAGKYSSQTFIYYQVSVDPCTGSNCVTQDKINEHILKYQFFSLDFYYSNTLLNPDQKIPIKSFFQDRDYGIFSTSLGQSTNLYIGNYILQTDESLYPWTSPKVEEGFIINRNQKQVWAYSQVANLSYCNFFIRKSNIRTQISRSFRKIDDMLSYMGGLFGLIVLGFGFIMNYYGQCAFQLQMCTKIFDYRSLNNDQQKKCHQNVDTPSQQSKSCSSYKKKTQIIQASRFGVLDFAFHLLYEFIRKFYDIEWKRMKIYSQSLQQIRYKLDISQIVQKLSFYDRSIHTLFEQEQLKLLYLQQKFNFQEVRDQRNMFNMRGDIIQNLFGLIQDEKIHQNTDQIVQSKNKIKRIDSTNRSSIKSFIGRQFNRIDSFYVRKIDTGQSSSQSLDYGQLNLPKDIKEALIKLQNNIQQGDKVSTRIYNGLQIDILQAFKNSKMRQQNKISKPKRKISIKKPLKKPQPGNSLFNLISKFSQSVQNQYQTNQQVQKDASNKYPVDDLINSPNIKDNRSLFTIGQSMYKLEQSHKNVNNFQFQSNQQSVNSLETQRLD